MCSGLEQCCVTCLFLLSLTLITAAAPWTKGTKEGDLLDMGLKSTMAKDAQWTEDLTPEESRHKLEPQQMVSVFEYNHNSKYLSREVQPDEELEAAEAQAEADRLARANRTKFNPSPDMDSENIKEEDITDPEESEMESLSVVWYLGAFGGLVTFFLVIVCSEFCFGNAMYRRHNPNEYINRVNVYADAYFPQTPPPPYHLFAPPTYTDTLQRKFNNTRPLTDKTESFDKESYDKNPIFIVPVHSNKMPYPPPSYTA